MTTLANLKLVGNINYISILDVSIHNAAGNHGIMKVKLLIEYQGAEEAAARIKGSIIKLTEQQGRAVFSGICTNVSLDKQAEYRELVIEVRSHSYKADIEKEFNTYQDVSKSILSIMQETFSEYSAWLTIDKNEDIPFILSQRNETDWEFLKRIAAQYGKEIFADTRVDNMEICIGESAVASKKAEYKVIGSHRDMNSMRTDMAALNINPSVAEYEIIDAETEDVTISTGDLLDSLRVVENTLYQKKGIMVNRISLQYKSAVRANVLESNNAELENQILTGRVTEVSGNEIKVEFETDKGGGETPWMPYENAINNCFYCMPDIDDEVYIYYDNTGKAICLGSKRNDLSDENFQKPEEKSMKLRNKIIRLGTEEMLVQAGHNEDSSVVSYISFCDTEGQEALNIFSDYDINIKATENLNLVATDSVEELSDKEAVFANFHELRTAGEDKYIEDGGRNLGDKLFLTTGSALKKAWNNLVDSGKSAIHYEGIMQVIGFFTKEEQVNGPVQPETYINYINLLAFDKVTIFTDDNNKIEIGVDIHIVANDFHWLGYSKMQYEEKSVENRDWIDRVLDGVQLVLDIAGMLPGVGAIPDLINAGISLMRGDFVGAGMSLFSAIPGVGDVAGGCKLLVKAAKAKEAIEGFMDAHKILKNCIDIVTTGATFVLGGIETVSEIQDICNREGTSGWEDAVDIFLTVSGYLADCAGEVSDRHKGDGSSDTGGNSARNTTTDGGGTGNGNGGDGNKKDGGGGSDGNDGRKQHHDGDPVNMVTGSLTLTHTDMNYNDILGKFSLVRSYESVYTNEDQLLGSKWVYNIESSIRRDSCEIAVRMPDNHIEHFIKQEDVWRNKREQDENYILEESDKGYELRSLSEKKLYIYDTKGNLCTISDRNNNQTCFSYENGVLSKMELASGQTITFYYEGKKLKSIRDNINREISYEYDGEYLIKVNYPNGAHVRYEYDACGNITKIWDENGTHYITNQYDRKNRVVKQRLADGEEYIYMYDDVNKVNTIVTVSNNRTVRYAYNRQKLVTKIMYQDQTFIEQRYDNSDNIVWYCDRMGNVTEYVYDTKGSLLQQTEADGYIQYREYDQEGNLVKVWDNAGAESMLQYDKQGNLLSRKVKISEKTYQETTFTYDEAGRMTSVKDANGNVTEYGYENGFYNPTYVKEADGYTSYYTYDQAGRMMSEDDGTSVMRYGYNHFDFRTSYIDEDGNTTKFVYDPACNLIKIIRPSEYKKHSLQGAGYEYKYDAMQHLVRITDPCGGISAVKVNSDGNATKEIHPNVYDEVLEEGKGIEYSYDTDGNRTHIRYPDGAVHRIKYNATGLKTIEIFPEAYEEAADHGAGYQYAYDSRNRLVMITDPAGTVIKRYVYDLAGNLVKEIDSKGMETGDTDDTRIGTHYRYNDCGWLLEKREPVVYEQGTALYRVTQHEYDREGNEVTEKRYLSPQFLEGQKGRVNVIHKAYDKRNRLARVTDSLGAVAEYRYDGMGRRTYESRKINDKHTLKTSYLYDKRGKLVQKLETADKKGTGKEAARTRYEYDEDSNLVRTILPEGYEIRYSYDKAGRVIREEHLEKGGISTEICYEYDKAGNVIKVIDGNGASICRTYDMLNRLVMLKGKNGGITAYSYDKNGNTQKIITPNEYEKGSGKGISYGYDTLGRMTTMYGNSGEVLFSQEFNRYGEVIRQCHGGSGKHTELTKNLELPFHDSYGRNKVMEISYEYDFAGRRTAAITGGGRKEQYRYDALGNLYETVDGNGNKTGFDYDLWGRATIIHKADGSEEKYAYDYAGNIISAVDGNGNEIRYEYNEINRLARTLWADETTEEFQYDLQGRLKRKICKDKNEISYTYNMHNSLTSRRSKGGMEEHFQYYNDGKLKSAMSGGMRYEYCYYADGMLKEKTASGRTLLAYEYDLNGNLISQRDITEKVTRYDYDEYDRKCSVYDNDVLKAEYDYNALGMIEKVKIPGIYESCYRYDGDGNITGLSVSAGGRSLVENSYRYDGNGNLLNKKGLAGETSYEYDSLNRLTSAVYPEYAEQFTYDKAGNRISHKVVNKTSPQGNGTVNKNIRYTYDNCNRLLTKKDMLAKDNISDSVQYTYDICGNLINEGAGTYSYDDFNRLSKVEKANGEAFVYRYDSEGLRAEVEENGRLVQYIFNRDKEVTAEESEEKGVIRYIRGLELICSDTESARNYYHYAADSKGEHLSDDIEEGKCYYYVTDEHGSVSYILNENADIENEYTYDAFGNIISSSEKVHNIFGYCGEQLDSATGQYYLRARFYNPVIGRFTQQDTYHGDGLNLYAYCQNNPVMYCDPTGHDSGSAADKKQLPMVVPQPGTQLPMVIPQPGTQLPAVTKNNNSLKNKQKTQADNAAGDSGSRTGNDVGKKDNSSGENSKSKAGAETTPSGNSSGKPKGNYAKESSRGMKRQNEAADILATEGYDITMLDEEEGGNGYGIAENSNPDFLIEGNAFDAYSPDANTSVKNIIRTIAGKTKKQATRIVLNLADYKGDVESLKAGILGKTNGDLKHLDELKVIVDGRVETWFVR